MTLLYANFAVRMGRVIQTPFDVRIAKIMQKAQTAKIICHLFCRPSTINRICYHAEIVYCNTGHSRPGCGIAMREGDSTSKWSVHITAHTR